MRLKTDEEGTLVLVEFGSVELERRIPADQGVSRFSAILDATGKLIDLELVTSKIEPI